MSVVSLHGAGFVHEAGTPFATRAVHELDLSVRAGEFVALLGGSQAGKSTVAKMLNGLYTPCEGTLEIEGVPVRDNDVDRMRARRTVGLVMQYPEAQLFESTVARDVAYGPKNLGVSDVDAAVANALCRVGLEVDQYGARAVGELSGGQRRRVALAGVLASRPKVLVVDEPCAGIDPGTAGRLLRILRELADDGTAVIALSNSSADLAPLADRIVVLHAGRIIADRVPNELLADTALVRRTGIGRPPMMELLAALADAGIEVGVRMIDEEHAAALIRRAVQP